MSQLFQTEDHYILHEGLHSLWCSRHNGTIEAKRGDDICSAWNPVCIGLVYGLIGKIKIHPDEEWRLILIKEKSLVGKIAEKHEIYRIDKIVIIPLSSAEPQELDLDRCQVHHFGIRKNQTISQTGGNQRQLQNAWKTLKTGVDIVKTRKKETKDREKFAKRICEEIFKLYNDTDSFFVCETFDLTNSIQRQNLSGHTKDGKLDWYHADPRFFWNRYMVSELLDMDVNEETRSLNSHWVVPVIQGYIQIENCLLDFEKNSSKSSPELSPEFSGSKHIEPMEYTIILISRRSIHRAGTRSKKRGIEDTGACANYVETEQIIQFRQHMTSFVQVRGSVPVYWSQSGLKYRPPPKLDRSEEEAYDAFCLHFEEQLTLYKSLCIINLAELVGKEKALSDAYLHHVMRYNSPNITYVMFDFHEYCRGMKFENVTMLTDGINDVIRSMRYCWVGPAGMICEQTGVFRVNCVDCLDRTNVVQTAIARIVMDTQLRKLGILPPDEVLPNTCKRIFQQIWANNGDAISRQYAGTAALKGDYTRTGERKLTGMMKDGMNSANRYYLRFRDSHRQAAIDLTLGKPLIEEVLLQGGAKLEEAEEEEEEDSELLEKEENLRQLLEDSKRMLIVEPEECMGGWCLINADPTSGDSDRQDMDVILLLSQRAVYVAWYDDDEEQITQYQRIFLEDIEKIEIGAEPAIFKSRFVCMRLHYRHYADEGFFHAFRIPTMRLFNNMIVAVKSQEDAKELLRAVYQGFAAAQEILSLQLPLEDKPKLERKKTRPHPEVQDIHQQQQEQTLSHIHIPRDVSATDLTGSTSSAHKSQTDSLDVTAKANPKRSPGPPNRARLFRMPDVSNIKKNIDRGLKNIQKVTSSVKSGSRSDKEGSMAKDAGKDQNRVIKQQGSRDDSDVPEGEDRRASTDLEQSIVLESCGLVSVGSSKRLSHGDLDIEESQSSPSPQPIESRKNDENKESKSFDGVNSSCSSSIHVDNGEETGSDVPADVQRRLSFLVPNLQLPSHKTRRVQRIFDNIQLDIQTKLKDKPCVSRIVFI